MTPLSLNALSGLLQNTGLRINPTASLLQGAVSTTGAYTQGTVTSSTVLYNLTRAITTASPSASYFTALTSIGSTTIPALGNSRPSTYVPPSTNPDTVRQYGFIGRIALQALYEYYGTNTVPTSLAPAPTLNLSILAQEIGIAIGWKNNTNQMITSAVNSQSFLQGTFSNTNDLITADITGVTLATTLWGQELINIGQAIDLAYIDRFGEPVALFQVLDQNKAITDALSLVMSTVFSITEIDTFKTGIANISQQATLYACYTLITGEDLGDILAMLNVKTVGIESLADLLSPLKLFPNTANTLLYPLYAPTATVNKASDFIYINDAVNPRLPADLGETLAQMLPYPIAVGAKAFSNSMLQIKNVMNMQIGQFAQVVANLETTKDLPLVAALAQPTPSEQSAAILNNIANGSGESGLYTMADFFGSMSGLYYDQVYAVVKSLILRLQTSTLATIYETIYNTVSTGGDPSTSITAANAEIAAILAINPSLAAELNQQWNLLGSQLLRERNAIQYSIGNVTDLIPDVSENPINLNSFISGIEGNYAIDTSENGIAAYIEAISDMDNLPGQSIIAVMRQTRNASRLSIIDADPILEVDDSEIVPLGAVPQDQMPLDERPNCLGIDVASSQPIPGFLLENDDSTVPYPVWLPSMACNGIETSTFSVDEAITEVERCNCDCWNV